MSIDLPTWTKDTNKRKKKKKIKLFHKQKQKKSKEDIIHQPQFPCPYKPSHTKINTFPKIKAN